MAGPIFELPVLSADLVAEFFLLIFVGKIRADFWAGDPTKHFSVKKRGFQ